MLFNSIEFLLVFLPLTLVGFAVLTRREAGGRAAVSWLVAASLVFYAWWNWRFVGLLVGSAGFNFIWALRIERNRSNRWWLVSGVVANLMVLGWFKYAGFMAENAKFLLGTAIELPEIILPLAVSFFTFHQIAYLVDVHHGHKPERSFLYYGLFIFFFPHLIAGPIIRHWELLPQFRRPEFRASLENVGVGVVLLTMGLVKKVFLAAPMQAYADRVFQIASFGEPVTFVPAWAAALAFSMQIYFDFSGYSDMALGLARMCGTRLPVNFNSPYKATSIIEFWRRWHITLSRFLRDYLYIPLGGNRRGPVRRLANLAVVMLLGGLWHGASWTFVVWGGAHGLMLAVNHAWRSLLGGRPAGRAGRWAGWAITMIAVTLAWVVFRAPSWLSAETMLSAMTGFNGVFLPESYGSRLGGLAPLLAQAGLIFGASPDTLVYPTRMELAALAACSLWVMVLPNSQEILAAFDPVFEKVARSAGRLAWRPSMAMGIVAGLIMTACLANILQNPSNAFIYFQF